VGSNPTPSANASEIQAAALRLGLSASARIHPLRRAKTVAGVDLQVDAPIMPAAGMIDRCERPM
jgi:hypothetical protein